METNPGRSCSRFPGGCTKARAACWVLDRVHLRCRRDVPEPGFPLSLGQVCVMVQRYRGDYEERADHFWILRLLPP